MKIHYSPCFDGEHYIDFQGRGNLLIDEIVVGNSGLLKELELRGGLTCECLPDVERQANYYNAVKSVVGTNPDCFIKKSFKIDEYGVASELLRWRDELVLAGWNSDIRDVSSKLDLLSDIERTAQEQVISIKGESDRWQALIACGSYLLQKDDELFVHFPQEHLPQYIGAIVRKLSESGINCTYKVKGKSIAEQGTNLNKIQNALLNGQLEDLNPVSDDTFRILRFDRQSSALDWVVTNNNGSKAVFVNSDNSGFDNVQMLFGNPASGSSLSNANPEIVQMFKLGCSLFIRPLNIYNLLSYLQISKHPLPYKLRHNLIDVIISEGGIINQKWDDVISQFIAEEEHNAKFIDNYLPLGVNGNEIVLEDLRKYVRALRSWASKTLIILQKDEDISSNDLILQQMSSLRSFCNAFIIILHGQDGDSVSSEKLRSWILSIYKPTHYSVKDAEKGSRLVVGSPAAFVDDAEEVIWIDCFNGTPKAAVHQFLNAAEQEHLTDNGLMIWSEEAQLKSQLYSQKMAILSCKSRFTLIVSDKDKGEKLSAHPVMVQLSAQFPDLKKIELKDPDPDGESVGIIRQDLPEIPVMIDMGQRDLFTPREKESYTSIDSLIQDPLDWVLNHQAGFTQSSVVEMSDEKRTMGNVAHLFIQMLVNDSGKDLSAMKQTMLNNYNEKLNAAVLQKGAVLLLDENKILLTRFANQLRQSVNNLLGIIELNGLNVHGCEHVAECEFEDMFLMEARIDLLLTNREGDYVIFDLKWTTSKTYYNKLIMENRALQLEVYRKVLEKAEPGRHVDAVGYFDLRHGLLETSHTFKNTENIRVTEPDNAADIFDQSMNSYTYRWVQLQAGKIEVADSLELALLEYHSDCAKNNLFPLKTDFRDKDLKAVNDFSNFKTFKGGLK